MKRAIHRRLNPSSKFLLLWDVKCSFSKALPPLFLIEFYNPKWIFGLLFDKMISYIFLLFSIIWSFYVPGNDYNSDSLCFTIKKLIENKCFDFVSHFINDHSWTDWIWKLQTISIKGADLSKNNLKAFIDALVGEKVSEYWQLASTSKDDSYIGLVGHHIWWENRQNRSFGPKSRLNGGGQLLIQMYP
jgi:hypothetical protein